MRKYLPEAELKWEEGDKGLFASDGSYLYNIHMDPSNGLFYLMVSSLKRDLCFEEKRRWEDVEIVKGVAEGLTEGAMMQRITF